MKLTRRQLAAAISATVSATALSRTQLRAQDPQPSAVSDELQAARGRLKANSDLLAQQDVPAATEPAFRFQA
jgi:hypothetical protein